MEMGTSRVEGLVSYVKRLAYAHNVKVNSLVSYLITLHPNPLIHPKSANNQILSNGMSRMINVVAESLEKLNLMHDLKFSTMLPWQSIINYKTLLGNHKKWCTVCLREWKENGVEMYDPLIWDLGILNICPEHFVKLNDSCPNLNCKSYQWYGMDSFVVGHCQTCNEFLGVEEPETENINIINKEITAWDIWVANNLRDMVVKAPNLTIPKQEKMYTILNNCINDFFQGNRINLCKALEIEYFRFRKIEEAQYRLSLRSFLLLSYLTKLRVTDLIYYGLK